MLVREAEAAGVKVYANSAIVNVKGGKRVRGAEVMDLNEDGTDVVGAHFSIDCDCIAMSGGWNPTVHLFSQSRGKLVWDEVRAMFVPGPAPKINPSRSAGACNGSLSLAACLGEGAEAGAAAASRFCLPCGSTCQYFGAHFLIRSLE